MTRLLVTLMLLVVLGLQGCATQRPVDRAPGPTQPNVSTDPQALPPGYIRSYVVFGKRYYILGSSRGYREQGLASWYGPKFHGRKTANGETYNMHGMSAAHKSLPLGTWVRVTNQSNKRVLDLRINDRGPFVDNRIIDLSFAAAKALDVVGPGTAPVQVVALQNGPGVARPSTVAPTESNNGVSTTTIDRPAVIESRPIVRSAPVATPSEVNPSIAPPLSTQPVRSAPASATPRSGTSFIQVASFGEVANAQGLATQLRQSGFSNVVIQALNINNRLMHRVRLGPLASIAQQQSLLDRLTAIGLRGARVVSE